MGQKASTVREFTPDTKPLKKENDFSLEKRKKENEINARESLKAIQKRLGVNVLRKDSEMLMETESFIMDAIVVETLKHSGNSNLLAKAISEKLTNQYGGNWSVIIGKIANTGFFGSKVQGSQIDLTYDGHAYAVFNT